MATMYVGGGLYLPTTGTASKPKTTSTPTGGTVTVAQRNAIASKTKPAATTVAKKPTTNTLSSMAGSSLGATSTKKPTVASPASTSSMGTSRSVTRSGNTDAQNAAVASLLSGAGTGGINAVRRSANPVNVVGYRPPPVGSSTHGMIVNSPGNYPPTSFQSLQNAASSLAAIQAAQRERDARAAKTPQLFGGGYAPFVQPERVGTPPPPGVYPGSVAYNDWQSRLLQSGGVPQHFATPVTVPPMATKDEYAAGGKYADRNWYADTLGYGATQFRHGLGDLLGTPISALNSAATGVQMLAGNPNPDRSVFFGGGEDFKRILDFGGAIPTVPARDRAQENLGLLAYLAGGAGLPVSVPGKAGAVLTPARVSAPRVAAPIVAAPRAAAGIDAALTPRQVAFRELMDNLNANPANAVATPTPAVSPGPRIPQDGVLPPTAIPPAEIARLENILGNLGYSAPRPAAAGPRLPGAANALDEGFVSRAAAANDDRLLANMMRENDARSLTNAIDENDAGVLSNAVRENDTLNALNTAREVRPARGSELFPDINPAATISDPMDVLRPVFMSADEAADVIRPGPRVAADAGMDPVTKRMLLAAGGAGVAIPGLAGLSLLANGQLTPAPPATTPQPVAVPDGQRGIDAAGAPVSNETLNAFANSRGNMSLRLPGGAGQVSIPTKDGTIILPAPKDVAPAVDPVDSAKVLPADTSLTGTAVEDAEAAFMDPVEVAKREAATNSAEGRVFGSDTPLEPGPAGDEADTAAPAAGKKFTPGPGQFVGTNGYIYEQSSDGSFEQVGRVPGYTPAQLYEAANKGAFRDPNNIVTGGAKPKKKARKKGEKNFIDKAGDILKERFDDSLFAQLFLNQDDEAAPETAATGPEAVEYYSTPPSSVPESLVSSSGSSKKRKPKDETDGGTGTGGTGTGTGGTGTGGTPTQAMIDALYAPYMRQYTGPGAGYVPGVSPEWNYFTPAFADGGLVDGRLVLGDGGPKEDKIPAMIDGVEQAKLSNGEFVMTAAAVKNAGGGDIELGAKRLMDLNNMLSYGQPAERLKVQHVK